MSDVWLGRIAVTRPGGALVRVLNETQWASRQEALWFVERRLPAATLPPGIPGFYAVRGSVLPAIASVRLEAGRAVPVVADDDTREVYAQLDAGRVTWPP